MGNYNTTMHKSVASNGKANLGVVLGAIGTAGVLSNSNNCGRGCNNGGLLGNLFGNNNCDCYVDEKEFAWAQAFNAKEAELAKEKAERYADGVGLGLYEQLVAERKEIDAAQNDGFRTLFEEIRAQDKELAILKSDVRCLSVLNEEQHEAIRTDYTHAIKLEAERRRCADDIISEDIACNYVKAKKVIPAEDICPQVQLKCPDVQLVEIITTATQAFASAMGVNSARAVAK